jgi:hypothetical protein
MATLVIQGMKKQIVTEYERASEEEKLQVNKVIEEIVDLWARRQPASLQQEHTRRDLEAFIRDVPTFPLDWRRHKLTREEMNAR